LAALDLLLKKRTETRGVGGSHFGILPFMYMYNVAMGIQGKEKDLSVKLYYFSNENKDRK